MDNQQKKIEFSLQLELLAAMVSTEREKQILIAFQTFANQCDEPIWLYENVGKLLTKIAREPA